jgi:hypothetical protein
MRNTEQLDVTSDSEPMPYDQMVFELAEFDAAGVSVAEALDVYEDSRKDHYNTLSYFELSERYLQVFWS